jgi:hypothetical protein
MICDSRVALMLCVTDESKYFFGDEPVTNKPVTDKHRDGRIQNIFLGTNPSKMFLGNTREFFMHL